METHSFSINNSVDFLHIFQEKVNDYLDYPLSSGKAVICAMFAWHLVDWVFHEYKGRIGSFSEPKNFNKHMKKECISLAFMQDVTNGTKHKFITKYTPKVKDTRRHKRAFSSGFSKGFDVSCLKLILDNETVVYFDEEVEKARTFWVDYFNNKLGESV